MRQLGSPDHVADGADSLHAGLQPSVHLDGAAPCAHSESRQAKSLQIAFHTHRHQHLVDLLAAFALLPLVAHFDLVLPGLDSFDPDPGFDFDSLLLQTPIQKPGHLLVLPRQHLGQGLQHLHPCAEGIVEIGELDPDGPGSDDDHGIWTLIGDHGLLAAQDQPAVDLHSGNAARPSAGGNDDVTGVQKRDYSIVPVPHFHLFGRRDEPPAGEHLDPVLAHQVGNPGGQLIRHTAAAADDLLPIESYFTDLETEFAGALEEPVDLRLLEQGLGWNTAPIETNPAEGILLFHHRGLQAQLAGPDGSGVASWSCPDDGDIELFALCFHELPAALKFDRRLIITEN